MGAKRPSSMHACLHSCLHMCLHTCRCTDAVQGKRAMVLTNQQNLPQGQGPVLVRRRTWASSIQKQICKKKAVGFADCPKKLQEPKKSRISQEKLRPPILVVLSSPRFKEQQKPANKDLSAALTAEELQQLQQLELARLQKNLFDSPMGSCDARINQLSFI